MTRRPVIRKRATVPALIPVALVAVCGVLLAGGAVHADLWSSLGRILGSPGTETTAGSPLPGTAAPGADTSARPGLARTLAGFSDDEELAIGREIAGRILGAAPLVPDAAIQERVNLVGRWVALQGERPDLPWRFGVIESEEINAFAAPGGAILITRGLYRKLTSESELAGVLAHEIAHVISRHHLKLLQKDALLQLGLQTASRHTGGRHDVARWIGTGAELFARGLDRTAELEADRMAVVLAARAGYDPFGFPAVLQEMGHAAPDDAHVALLFSTHPPLAERLTHLDAAIGNRFQGIEETAGDRPPLP